MQLVIFISINFSLIRIFKSLQMRATDIVKWLSFAGGWAERQAGDAKVHLVLYALRQMTLKSKASRRLHWCGYGGYSLRAVLRISTCWGVGRVGHRGVDGALYEHMLWVLFLAPSPGRPTRSAPMVTWQCDSVTRLGCAEGGTVLGWISLPGAVFCKRLLQPQPAPALSIHFN